MLLMQRLAARLQKTQAQHAGGSVLHDEAEWQQTLDLWQEVADIADLLSFDHV